MGHLIGGGRVKSASNGIEPDASYLELYLGVLNPTDKERELLGTYIKQYNSNFRFREPMPDYEI